MENGWTKHETKTGGACRPHAAARQYQVVREEMDEAAQQPARPRMRRTRTERVIVVNTLFQSILPSFSMSGWRRTALP
jgi:hypothetical protein